MTSSTQPRFRVLVTGGRDYQNIPKVIGHIRRLAAEHNDRIIFIQGGCPSGPDAWTKTWCDDYGLFCITAHAPWSYHGKSAGPIRNSWMLELSPDLVLAFPGGKGTADMVRKARAAGIEVREVQ